MGTSCLQLKSEALGGQLRLLTCDVEARSFHQLQDEELVHRIVAWSDRLEIGV